MKDRSNQFEDTTLKPEIIENFGTLRQFAKGTGIDYDQLNRVVNCKPAATEEIDQVLQAYSRLDPKTVDEQFNKHAAEPHTVEEHIAYTGKLYRVVCDLYAALKKTQENPFA